jgi:HK97 family phage portal protein
MPTIRQRIQNAFEKRRIGKYDSANFDVQSAFGLLNSNQVHVTENNAMRIAAVYACSAKISSTIAQLDAQIWEESDAGKNPGTSHPVHDVLMRTPNDYQTPFEFFETVTAYAILRGRGYAVIERDEAGYATKMHCVPTDEVDETITPQGRAFKVQKYGIIMPEDMIEIYNLQRQSPISLHRDNLGLSVASKNFGRKYFEDGQLTGVVSTDQPLRREQIKEVRDNWREQGAAGIKLVPHGLKYQRISISPDEAQFLGVQKFQAEEICRIFNVPPSLIWLDNQTTYNNVEQQQIMFARQTISPWVTRWEQELNRKLIQKREKPKFVIRMNMDEMYRADMEARVKFYDGMIKLGVMSINEIRNRENMNPVDGGDMHFVQLNQIALSQFENHSEKIANQNVTKLADVTEEDNQNEQ